MSFFSDNEFTTGFLIQVLLGTGIVFCSFMFDSTGLLYAGILVVSASLLPGLLLFINFKSRSKNVEIEDLGGQYEFHWASLSKSLIFNQEEVERVYHYSCHNYLITYHPAYSLNFSIIRLKSGQKLLYSSFNKTQPKFREDIPTTEFKMTIPYIKRNWEDLADE